MEVNLPKAIKSFEYVKDIKELLCEIINECDNILYK
jgi:hypothetical protein